MLPFPLLVHDIAFGGKGVGRTEGMVVFVPFTIAGEQVTARLTKRKKNFAEADLVSVEQASPDRVVPPVSLFRPVRRLCLPACLVRAPVAAEEFAGGANVAAARKAGSCPDATHCSSPREYGYRNRIRVHVEGRTVGFYQYGRHELIDVEQCPIAAPAVNEELADLRRALVADGDYILRASSGGEYFVQTNDAVAAAMLEVVRGLAPGGFQTLVDAYAGAGFFAKGLADRFEQVIGIEENGPAVEYARRTAGPKESYVAGTVESQLGEVLAGADRARTCLILDPPAQGMAPRALEYILGAEPAEVIYVSCDPATLARDLAMLCRTYKLRSVTPVDMFPQTAEIEAVAHLSMD